MDLPRGRINRGHRKERRWENDWVWNHRAAVTQVEFMPTIWQRCQGHGWRAFDTDYERAKAFAQERGAYAASTIEELCSNREVEAVIITTPNNSHRIPAICAAKAGKHVFCEKPVALSFEDTKEMIDTAEKAGVYFFAAHTTNFIRGVQTAKALLASGAVGELLMIEAVHTDWAGPQKFTGWKQRKDISGGHLYHHMHEADLICQLAGLPVSVYANGKNLVHHGAGCGDEEDAIFLIMELSGGGFASLTIGSAFHLGDHFVKLQGKTGGILLDFKNSVVRLENDRGEKLYSMQENEEEDEERRNGYRKHKADAGKGFGKPGMKTSSWMSTIFYKELKCFNDIIRTGNTAPEYEPLLDGSAALNCVKVLDGARESMALRLPVRLEE